MIGRKVSQNRKSPPPEKHNDVEVPAVESGGGEIELCSDSPLSNKNDDLDVPCRESVNKYKEEMRKRRKISVRTSCCRAIVDRVQSIYIPVRYSSYIPVSTSDSEEGLCRGSIHPPGRIPIVSGLDPVIIGTEPASETVYICGMKPIRYLWYMLSGFL